MSLLGGKVAREDRWIAGAIVSVCGRRGFFPISNIEILTLSIDPLFNPLAFYISFFTARNADWNVYGILGD